MSKLKISDLRSRLRGPTAPVPLRPLLAVDGCMLVSFAALAVVDGPWWSLLVPLAFGAFVLVLYGRRAAVAMGIRSLDETPRDWLFVFILLSGFLGVLVAHAGRYGGLVFMAYLVCGQAVERIAWARFKPPPTSSH